MRGDPDDPLPHHPKCPQHEDRPPSPEPCRCDELEWQDWDWWIEAQVRDD
jgi:hypothetical protein